MEEKGQTKKAGNREEEKKSSVGGYQRYIYYALRIEIDDKNPTFDQLVDIVHKFNEDLSGQEELVQRA